jgi:hypothetical protein
MAVGYSDLKNVIRLPVPWDAGYLMQWKLKDGTTFDKVVQDIGSAIVLFNRALAGSYWAQFARMTTDPAIDDNIGGEGGSELTPVSEYGRPDTIHGDATGHMLPLKDYGGALGWTYMALRRAIKGRIDLDIRRLIERSQNTWDKRMVERLFKSLKDSVGNTGVSVGFADAGVADADYVPPTYNGKFFASTHNHFSRTTFDATGRSASLVTMSQTLLEHGVPSPWHLIIPEADIALWTAQAEFKKPYRDWLTTTSVETRALFPSGQVARMGDGATPMPGVDETFIGMLEVDRGLFLVKYSPRLPTAYAGAFKNYGFGSPDAPLAIRYEEGFPMGLTLVGEVNLFPLEDAIAYFTFGVGVGNRVAGTATFYNPSGNYVDPVIS